MGGRGARIVEAEVRLALRLRPVQRRVGAVVHRLEIRSLLGYEHHAGRGRELDGRVTPYLRRPRLAAKRANAPRQAGLRDIVAVHDELVAAPAAHQVVLAECAAQMAPRVRQRRVAGQP